MIANKTADVAMYGGAASSLVLWGLRVGDVAAMVSAVIALLGFAVHVWATLRRDKREAERHRVQMERGIGVQQTNTSRGD